MTLNELNSYFGTLLNNITSEDSNVNRQSLLAYVLPALNLARLTDSEEISESYFLRESEKVEVDGYQINESGERLQLFLSNLVLPTGDFMIPRKEYYDQLFTRAKNFFSRSVRKQLTDVQAGDPASVLIRALETAKFQEQIDVLEIFLISNTISIESRGSQSPKIFVFNDDEISITYTIKDIRKTKRVKVKYQLIDLNKIYNFEISDGNAEPIVINFDPLLPAIQAADNTGVFKSYLAVLPATLLVQLYHDYSSRLLERNVRSFLQFNKEVNKPLKETIRLEPEKFIAYNNGLTVTAIASDINHSEGVTRICSLTDFQIVNGGQTTASIYFANKEGIDISKVNVTVKINIVNAEDRNSLDDLISKISQYSNSQNKVSSVDLKSRSPYLVKIKKLSESITDPSGTKWFFERIRGDFNTMVRMNPKQKTQIERNYPKQKRLSKEQVAKYYVAWGTSPFLVRKGGEKVFRDFMDFIQFDHTEKAINPESIGRAFYEDLIAKALLFKGFEQIYGAGAGAIGQIRSSVVPYALSLLYKMTTVKKLNYFDLGAIWVAQGIPEDLKALSHKLLRSVHDWLKSYSKSDDVGEYAKKEELWDVVSESREFADFENHPETKEILARYRLTESDFKKRYLPIQTFDFSLINENCRIHSNGAKFYISMRLKFYNELSVNEERKTEELIQKIKVKQNLSQEIIDFENQLTKKVQSLDPDFFLGLKTDNTNLINGIGKVASIYNKNIHRVKEAFEAETSKLKSKGIREHKANAFRNVGINLSRNEQPLIADLYCIADFLS